MKIRRLSEIDLARIAPLEADEKRHRLRLLKSGGPPHTYNPLRRSLGDILNLQPEMFGGGDYTPWANIESAIRKVAKSDSEEKFNLAVAKSLYNYGVGNEIRSYAKPITPWPVGYGQSVAYWWNLYTVLADQSCFVFADPRLSNPLTKLGRRFTFSMMHQRIRVPDPDFFESRLLITQFTKGLNGARDIRLFDAAEIELYTVDQLNEMIDETYKIWLEVLRERVEDEHKKAAGSTPMGF